MFVTLRHHVCAKNDDNVPFAVTGYVSDVAIIVGVAATFALTVAVHIAFACIVSSGFIVAERQRLAKQDQLGGHVSNNFGGSVFVCNCVDIDELERLSQCIPLGVI